MPLIFLHHFGDEISKPISDSVKAYEYVPTQVMTEYFRHLFHRESGEPLNGIAFRSSKNPGGICYTLFFDSTACVDNAADAGAAMLLKNAGRSMTSAPNVTTTTSNA
jgi:RES domain